MNIAKKAIDNIASTGIAYKEDHRSTKKCMVLAICTPCIIFSGFVRLISCPFQCLFNRDVSCNPVFACLTDSSLTMPSDECVFSSLNSVDDVVTLPIMTDEEQIEVLKYAANAIQNNTPIIKHRYAIATFVQPIMFTQTLSVNSTPSSVIVAVEKMKP
jgi:hypothetical protein